DYPAEVSNATKKIQKIVKDMNKELLEEQELRATADARIEELSNDLQLKIATIERLERTINDLKTTADETTDLQTKNRALQAELDAIQTQLEKMSETYKELVSEQEATIPVQELLALYIALLEDVFYAQPHAKTLFLLHGRKKEMTREEIVKTAGHEPTAIRKALGDLSRAELIDYDVEAGKASLKKRLYPT
ncbi:MAG: hypothetical protein ACFFDE_04480, partial [Promethearchaeota archaeon]